MLYLSVYFAVTSMQLCSDESNKLKLKGHDWTTQWGGFNVFYSTSPQEQGHQNNYCGPMFLHPRFQLSLREPEYPEKTHGHSAGEFLREDTGRVKLRSFY